MGFSMDGSFGLGGEFEPLAMACIALMKESGGTALSRSASRATGRQDVSVIA